MGDRLGTPHVVDIIFNFSRKTSDIASPSTAAMVSVWRRGPPYDSPPIPMADDLSWRFSLSREQRTLQKQQIGIDFLKFWLLLTRVCLCALCLQCLFLLSLTHTRINSKARPCKTRPKHFLNLKFGNQKLCVNSYFYNVHFFSLYLKQTSNVVLNLLKYD